ncbi:MAG: hypothetical protein QOD60_2281 [Solirubrobacterales bacterium]|nr:hypothetical protein [Solirubrobacterales bacterium]
MAAPILEDGTLSTDLPAVVPPLSAVFRAGLATYRAHWQRIVGLSTLVLVPAAVLAAGADQLLEHAVGKGSIGTGILALAAIALASLGYYFLKGVLAHLVVDHREGRHPPGIAEVAATLPYGAMIVVDLSLAAAVGVGLELLILPGVLVGTYFGLAPILVEVEELGVRDAFRRSRDLVRGSFLLVFLVLFVTLVGTELLSLPLKALGGAIFPGGAGDPFEEGLGLLLAGIIVKPVGAITTIELTLDLAA